jgi:hypothetical protein
VKDCKGGQVEGWSRDEGRNVVTIRQRRDTQDQSRSGRIFDTFFGDRLKNNQELKRGLPAMEPKKGKIGG